MVIIVITSGVNATATSERTRSKHSSTEKDLGVIVSDDL